MAKNVLEHLKQFIPEIEELEVKPTGLYAVTQKHEHYLILSYIITHKFEWDWIVGYLFSKASSPVAVGTTSMFIANMVSMFLANIVDGRIDVKSPPFFLNIPSRIDYASTRISSEEYYRFFDGVAAAILYVFKPKNNPSLEGKKLITDHDGKIYEVSVKVNTSAALKQEIKLKPSKELPMSILQHMPHWTWCHSSFDLPLLSLEYFTRKY